MLYLFKITDYNRINLLDALVQYIRSEIYYIGFTPKNQTLNKYLSQILRLAQPSQPRHTFMIKLENRDETDDSSDLQFCSSRVSVSSHHCNIQGTISLLF